LQFHAALDNLQLSREQTITSEAMTMKRKIILIAIAAAACFALPLGARASEKDDADSLERLMAEIAHRLPAGWQVTADPAHRQSPHGDDESPALVIASKDKLPVETQFPGSAPGQEPFKELRQVEIVLAVRPFLTPEEYSRVHAKDDGLIESRNVFERKLRDMPWAYKGSAPIPPSAFRPRNDQDRRLIMEYALLWNRTEPQLMPTHYFEGLSFNLTLPLENSVITDKSKAKECAEIVKSLEGLLKPYDKPSQSSN
jgi:hypothetical protein